MDNTRVACACADGQVLLAEVLGRKLTDRHLTVTLQTSDTISVVDGLANVRETIGKVQDAASCFISQPRVFFSFLPCRSPFLLLCPFPSFFML